MSKQQIRSHIAWLARVTEDCLRCAAVADKAGDLATAADFYAAAERHADSAIEWAGAL